MKTTNLIVIGLMALVTQACGGASGSAPSDVSLTTPGATPSPTPVTATQAFAFTEPNKICDALKSWNPNVTNIQFPGDPAGYSIYTFTASKITQNAITLTDYFMNIGTGGTPVCSIYLTAGKLVKVQ